MPVAPTTAWPALGSTISYSPDGTTFTPIGQVTSISGAGGGEVGERDTTSLSSLAKTAAPTLLDPGEVTFEVNFDPTDIGHQQLRSWKDNPPATMPQWKVTWASGTPHTSTFSGFVKTFDGVNAGGVDENITASITIRVNGAYTHA